MRKYKEWAAEKFPGHLEKSAGGGTSSKSKQKRPEQTHPKAPQNKIAKIAKRAWSAGAMKLWNGSTLTESQVSQVEGFLATYSMDVTKLLEATGSGAEVDQQAEHYKAQWCRSQSGWNRAKSQVNKLQSAGQTLLTLIDSSTTLPIQSSWCQLFDYTPTRQPPGSNAAVSYNPQSASTDRGELNAAELMSLTSMVLDPGQCWHPSGYPMAQEDYIRRFKPPGGIVPDYLLQDTPPGPGSASGN